MNRLIQSLVNVLWQFDRKQLHRMLAVVVGGCLLMCAILIYVQIRSFYKLRREMIMINTERIKIRDLLTRNEFLKKERQRAQTIIDQDKQFKIIEYINNLVTQLHIKENFKITPVTINPLEHLQSLGYEEVKMDAEFINLNMRQLVQLLQELEQNKRIDIKQVEIERSQRENAINVLISISTLQHKAETASAFETE